MHRISTAAYAFGYLGGGLLLALNLAWISNPPRSPALRRTTLPR